jgi:hypothetical protein
MVVYILFFILNTVLKFALMRMICDPPYIPVFSVRPPSHSKLTALSYTSLAIFSL